MKSTIQKWGTPMTMENHGVSGCQLRDIIPLLRRRPHGQTSWSMIETLGIHGQL